MGKAQFSTNTENREFTKEQPCRVTESISHVLFEMIKSIAKAKTAKLLKAAACCGQMSTVKVGTAKEETRSFTAGLDVREPFTLYM